MTKPLNGNYLFSIIFTLNCKQNEISKGDCLCIFFVCKSFKIQIPSRCVLFVTLVRKQLEKMRKWGNGKLKYGTVCRRQNKPKTFLSYQCFLQKTFMFLSSSVFSKLHKIFKSVFSCESQQFLVTCISQVSCWCNFTLISAVDCP